LNPGETKEEGKLTHTCESKEGTLVTESLIKTSNFYSNILQKEVDAQDAEKVRD
jgi:hypothetical protein